VTRRALQHAEKVDRLVAGDRQHRAQVGAKALDRFTEAGGIGLC
jgi:hypothetical protein